MYGEGLWLWSHTWLSLNHVLRACLKDLYASLLWICDGLEFQKWASLTEKNDWLKQLFQIGTIKITCCSRSCESATQCKKVSEWCWSQTMEDFKNQTCWFLKSTRWLGGSVSFRKSCINSVISIFLVFLLQAPQLVSGPATHRGRADYLWVHGQWTGTMGALVQQGLWTLSCLFLHKYIEEHVSSRLTYTEHMVGRHSSIFNHLNSFSSPNLNFSSVFPWYLQRSRCADDSAKRDIKSTQYEPCVFIIVTLQVPEYIYPKDLIPDYSSILVPNVDNVRTDFLMQTILKQRKAVLLIGEQGTAKTVMIKVRHLRRESVIRERSTHSSTFGGHVSSSVSSSRG